MKKTLSVLILLLLAVALLVACGPDAVGPNEPVDPVGPGEGTDIPVVPSDDDPTFDLKDTTAYTVVVSEYSSDTEEAAAKTVRTALEAKFGNKPKLSSDWLTGAPAPEEVAAWREVLIGRADRPETEQVEQVLDVGYTIRVVGNKLIILGVNEEQTLKAAEYFANTLLASLTDGLAGHYQYDERYEATLLSTVYPTEDLIVAELVATDEPYGADPTGKRDSTFAIQDAINDCAERGGGTVFLPVGEYLVTSTLYLPEGVILRGDWQDPDSTDKPSYGTVILADPEPLEDHERDDLSAKPLINLFSNSGVVGLTFYYPNQNATKPIPYGYTIHSYSNNTATVRNVTLLNSYRGVGASLLAGDAHCIMQLDTLRICALESGVELDVSRDVGYAVDIRISPDYWGQAGGKYACANAAALGDFCRENTVGLTIKSLDDEHFSTLDIEGCRTAIHITQPASGSAFWGLIYDVAIEDCTYGIVADRINEYGGICIAMATIDADEYAVLNSSGSGALKLCGVEPTGRGGIVSTGGARTVLDEQTDLSHYEIAYGSYPTPAAHLYVAPVKALSETKKDVSALIQQTLDKAAATGGIVYIPAGYYTLHAPIRVPAGVQLRGASDIYTYTYVQSEVCGSILLSYVDEGATITLAEGAGINGLVVFSPTYAPDYALELTEEGDALIETAVTVRGTGKDVYVVNSTLLGNFVGIDFTDCDGHVIREAFGCAFNAFARVGGRGGVVDRVMNTFHMIDRNPLANMGMLDATLCDTAAWKATHNYEAEAISTLRDDLLRTHYNVIEIIGAEGEQVSNVFMFTPGRIIYTEQAEATLINISSDAHGLEPMFDITDGSDVLAVNVLRSGGKSLRVDEGSEFKLYNRVAISDWYEPNFDSTRGDAQERTYREYDRLLINDGTLTGISGVKLYEGDEFAKSGNTSLLYESDLEKNVDTVFLQVFDAIDLTPFMTEDGYLHLWVYVDDLTNIWWSGFIQVESATGGNLRWATSTSLRSHGWNELYLPLTGAVRQGTFDASRVVAVRMTNQVGVTLEHPRMYIDDICFTLAHIDQPVELLAQSDVKAVKATTPLRDNVPPTPAVHREVVDGKLMMFDCETAWGKLLLNADERYRKQGKYSWRARGGSQFGLALNFDPVDISSFMEDGYLHFWIYIDGYLNLASSQIELTSSGECDVQEISWNAGAYVSRTGWTQVKLPLSQATPRQGEAFDPGYLNYLRIYFVTADGRCPDIYIDDIYFYDETPSETPPTVLEGEKKHVFTVGDSSETTYLTDKKGSLSQGKVRYADKTNKIIYKYSLVVTDTLSHLSWTAKVGQQLHLQVSTDMLNWQDVYRYDGPETDQGLPIEEREYDLLSVLKPYLTGKYMTVYVRVADASTLTGWGGAISVTAPVTLKAYYGEYVDQQDPPAVQPDEPDEPVGEYEKRQQLVFTVNTESEAQYLTAETGSFIVGTGRSRYADKARCFIYAYPISDMSTLSRLIWTAPTGQQLHLQVSFDQTNWVDVYRYVGEEGDSGLTITLRAYDLLAPLADRVGGESRRGTLYVKISDAYTATGWGGAIGINHPVTLHACYGEVDATNDPKDLLAADLSANRPASISSKLELSACEQLTDAVHGVTLNTDPAYIKQGKASFRHEKSHIYLEITLDAPMDVSEYMQNGYLHMWVYVDSATPLSVKDGQIELTSSGKCDNMEIGWFVKGHVLRAGWNELWLSLPDKEITRDPAFDPTAFNYLRFYCITTDGVQPSIYLDDIYFCK